MRTTERMNRLMAKLATIGQATDEALVDVAALAREGAGESEGANWLPGLKETLERIQLDCADARYAARELREAASSTDAVQPRLL